MKIVSLLLFVGLLVISTGPHFYYLWKKEDYKTFKVIVGIISLTLAAGVILIFSIQLPSIANIFNSMNHFVK